MKNRIEMLSSVRLISCTPQISSLVCVLHINFNPLYKMPYIDILNNTYTEAKIQ